MKNTLNVNRLCYANLTGMNRAESAEEDVGQDDSMEKSDVNDEPSAYVSCYPNSRRFSVADTMATNRPQYHTDNQGYSEDAGYGGDDEKKTNEREETKIDIPSPHPPSYSAVQDKMPDKKVKVCIEFVKLSPSF